MAATWRGKFNSVSWLFLSSKIGLHNPKIVKSSLNLPYAFVTTPTKTWIPQHARLLHVQCRQHTVVQRFKFSCSVILQQHLCQNAKATSTCISRGLFVTAGKPLFSGHTRNEELSRRGITMVSKKGKRKTCKAVAKRFIRTGKGKLKRWRCGKHHNQSKKSSRRKRFLRKMTYVSKTQLKTLNKMLNGW